MIKKDTQISVTGNIMLIEKLKVSVITPVLNAGTMIERCIDSVLRQEYLNIEQIVVDGGSQDDTYEKLKKYESKRLKWYHQPEKYYGAAGAVNYGMLHATGDIIVMLCADDFFEKDIVQKVVNAFLQYNVDIVSVGEQIVKIKNHAGTCKTLFYLSSDRQLRLSFSNITKGFSAISCRFFSKSFIKKVGFFMETDALGGYMYSNDKEFLLRSILLNPTHYIIPIIGHTTLFHSGSANFNEKPTIKRRLFEEHVYIANKLLLEKSLSKKQRNKLIEWKIQQKILLICHAGARGEKVLRCIKKTFSSQEIFMFLRALFGMVLWKGEIIIIRILSFCKPAKAHDGSIG